MERIVSWCLRNKSVVFLATILLIASGIFATTRLNQELLPDIEFPIITVSTPVPGAGPDAVDEQVTRPIEGAIQGIENVEAVQANSAQGFSIIILEFDLDADTEEAEREIQSALEGVGLPSQAQEPEVSRQSASEFPIMNVSLAADDGDLATLTEYAEDEVIPSLEEVEGIGRVELIGGSERRIEVDLDPAALQENGLSSATVAGAISSANANAPVGTVQVEGLSTPVRVASELETAEALRNLPIGPAAAAGAAPAGAAPSGGAPPSGAPPGGAPPDAALGAAPAGAEPAEPAVLGEVAEVREVSSDLAGISRTDGEPSLGLNVTKAADADTVEVADGVVGALDEVRDGLGEEEVRVVFNSAEDVRESVSGLVQEGAIGAVLAIAVIFAFLRSMRATLVTAVSLPTSVLAALLFSWGYDLTLNILTLAGLTIAVGRVVDDAIVVLENSYRYVQQGYDPGTAALKGTTEVASAITSSTLTTTAVFVPLAVVGGIVSKFFVPLSLTVALALLASLIVSVTVIPVLVSVFIKRQVTLEEAPAGYTGDEPAPDSHRARREAENGGEPRSWEPAALAVLLLVVGVVIVLGWTGLLDGVSGAVSDAWSNIDFGSPAVLIALGVAVGTLGTLVVLGIVVLAAREARRPPRLEEEGSLARMYTPMLRWALRHRAAVLFLALLVFAGGIATAFFLPVSFFPPSEERLAIARIELAAGMGLERTDREVESFEDFLLDDRGVESYQISLGGEDNFDPNSPIRSDNQAQAFVTIAEDADPGVVLDRISDRGRELYGGGGFQAEILSNGPPQGELQATITGGTEGERREAAGLVSEELSGIDSVTNVRSDVAGGAKEIAIEVDPERAAATGLSPEAVAGALATLVGEGSQATLGETPVSVGVPDEAADSVEEIRALPLAPGLAVEDVADVREVEAPAARSRVDGEPAVQVTGRITGQDTQSVSAEAQEALADLNLPEDVEATVGGENEDIEESFRNLFLSIIVALALVFLILVVFFGSLLVPLVILLAVPLTTVGAFGGLYITNTALSLPSLLGILLLIGIVVSNAILLVDFAIKAREDHDTADEAVMAAGRARLRPILMTALATIFALLPLALGLAGGGNGLISSSLAITVIGGLATSTFLTLLVVPVGYSVLESARSRRKKKKGYVR